MRKWNYYDLTQKKHTSIKKPYSSHVEWVLQLLIHFLPRWEWWIVPVFAALFHDVFEDCSEEKIEKILQFIRRHLSKESGDDIIRIILVLTRPQYNQAKLYASLRLYDFPLDDISSLRGEALFSLSSAQKIVHDVLGRCESLHEYWSRDTTEKHNIVFCAPRDPQLWVFISHNLWSDRSSVISRLMNGEWLDQNIITDLYRFVQHCLFLWWQQHNQRFDWFSWEAISKFSKRMVDNLAAILQVVLMSEFTFDNQGHERIKKLIISLKISDQIYNTWDNYYLLLPDTIASEKYSEYVFKAKILFMRARLYQKLLRSQIWKNSEIDTIFAWVIHNLESILTRADSLGSPTLVASPSAPGNQ